MVNLALTNNYTMRPSRMFSQLIVGIAHENKLSALFTIANIIYLSNFVQITPLFVAKKFKT